MILPEYLIIFPEKEWDEEGREERENTLPCRERKIKLTK